LWTGLGDRHAEVVTISPFAGPAFLVLNGSAFGDPGSQIADSEV
jgi:hypothetical protein